jgi:hypothetical protein
VLVRFKPLGYALLSDRFHPKPCLNTFDPMGCILGVHSLTMPCNPCPNTAAPRPPPPQWLYSACLPLVCTRGDPQQWQRNPGMFIGFGCNCALEDAIGSSALAGFKLVCMYPMARRSGTRSLTVHTFYDVTIPKAEGLFGIGDGADGSLLVCVALTILLGMLGGLTCITHALVRSHS